MPDEIQFITGDDLFGIDSTNDCHATDIQWFVYCVIIIVIIDILVMWLIEIWYIFNNVNWGVAIYVWIYASFYSVINQLFYLDTNQNWLKCLVKNIYSNLKKYLRFLSA